MAAFEKLQNVGNALGIALGNPDTQQIKQQRELNNLSLQKGQQELDQQGDLEIANELAGVLLAPKEQQEGLYRRTVVKALASGRQLDEQDLAFNEGNILTQISEVDPNLALKVQKQLAPPQATTDVRNAQFAFPDDPQAQRQAVGAEFGKPLTQVNLPKQQTESDKVLGKFDAESFTEVVQAGNDASVNNNRLNRARQLLSQVNTGALAPTVQTLKRLGIGLGVDLEQFGITDDTQFGEALNALTNDLALDQVARTKGAVSNKEMDLFQQIVPRLANTVEGNLLIIDMMERMNDLSIEAAKVARDYRRKNKGRVDSGLQDELAKFRAENPLFTEELQQKLDKVEKEPEAPSQIGRFKVEVVN